MKRDSEKQDIFVVIPNWQTDKVTRQGCNGSKGSLSQLHFSQNVSSYVFFH